MLDLAQTNEDADFADLVERTNAFFRKHARISNGHRVRELKPRLKAKLEQALEDNPDDALKAAHLVLFPKSSKKDIIKEYRATLDVLAEYLFTGQGISLRAANKVKIFTSVVHDQFQVPRIRIKAAEVLEVWGLSEASNASNEAYDALAEIACDYRKDPQLKRNCMDALFDLYDEEINSRDSRYSGGRKTFRIVKTAQDYLTESGVIRSEDEKAMAKRLSSLMSNKNRALTYNHAEIKAQCTEVIADIILSGMLTSQEAIDTLANIVLEHHTRNQQDKVNAVIDKVKGNVKRLKTRVKIIRDMTFPGFDAEFTPRAAANIPEIFKIAAQSPEGRSKRIAMKTCFMRVANIASPRNLIEYIKNDDSGFCRPELERSSKEILELSATFEGITKNKDIPKKVHGACQKAADFLSFYVSANNTSQQLAR